LRLTCDSRRSVPLRISGLRSGSCRRASGRTVELELSSVLRLTCDNRRNVPLQIREQRSGSSRRASGHTVALEPSSVLRLTCDIRRNVPLRIRGPRSGSSRHALALVRELISTFRLTCFDRCEHCESRGQRSGKSRSSHAALDRSSPKKLSSMS